MANFERVFDEIFDSIKEKSELKRINKSKSFSFEHADVETLNEAFDNLPEGPQEEYILQKQIRPYFGREGVNEEPIGTPPDFVCLEGTNNRKEQYTCTLFVDIKGSTRLSLLYPLDFVFTFKNAVIQACVEVIRAFDGHVHRLMGDAVMAFFGSSTKDKEDAIADAINCCITLRAILEQSIKPWMARKGLEAKDFGFRVGCDFGNDNEVLWGSFGYHNVGEVSATGLPVDMASKLQSLAGKNQTMLGQGLLDFVNWPAKYSDVKKNSKDEELPFVSPNITDKNGNSLNYMMKQLSYEKCIEFSALPISFREKINPSVISNPEIHFSCFAYVDGKRERYISATRYLQRDISLSFEVIANTSNRLSFPLKSIFTKSNHGRGVPEDERGIEHEGIIKYINKKRASEFNKSILPTSTVQIPEYTCYRGLHTMKCEVFDSKGVKLFCDWIGVMIK